MKPAFTGRDPRSGPVPDRAPAGATGAQDDGTTGHPSAADPVPATAPDDLQWCNGCRSWKPKAERVGFRCKQCATRAKTSPSRWTFDSAGNVISKGKQKCK